MAFHKLQSGEFMVCGILPRDAELKTVGEKNSSRTAFSVKAYEEIKPSGKKEAQWTNCVAWHELARICAKFKKGDYVLAVGKIETREFKDKTYKDLVVEFAVKAGGDSAAGGTINHASDDVRIDASDDLSDFETILNDGDIPF